LGRAGANACERCSLRPFLLLRECKQSADAIEAVPDEVRHEDGGDDLDCEVQGIGDVDEGINTGGAGKECRAEANGAKHSDPHRNADPDELCADERDGEHRQISEAVKDIGSIVEDREGFSCPDAGGGKYEQRGDENAGDEDGIGRGAVAGVKTCEPGWNEVVPARDHRQPSNAREKRMTSRARKLAKPESPNARRSVCGMGAI